MCVWESDCECLIVWLYVCVCAGIWVSVHVYVYVYVRVCALRKANLSPNKQCTTVLSWSYPH